MGFLGFCFHSLLDAASNALISKVATCFESSNKTKCTFGAQEKQRQFTIFDKALLPNSSAFSFFFYGLAIIRRMSRKQLLRLRGKSKCPVLHFQTISSRKVLMAIKCDAIKRRLQDLN